MNQKAKIKTLKVGMIPFWNLVPFMKELDRQKDLSVEMKVGAPTKINKWLHEGDIHLAPCSSICLNQSPFEMALSLGVSSFGPVRSVYLAFDEHLLPYYELYKKQMQILNKICEKIEGKEFNARDLGQNLLDKIKSLPSVPFADCPGMKFSTMSASSVALSKIFYAVCFGYDAYKFMAKRNFVGLSEDKKPIELLIGDEALIRNQEFSEKVDLSEFWSELTGLPFVFAVWQSRGLCLNGWRRKILEIGELADQKMRIEPTDYLPAILPKDSNGQELPLIQYWKNIKYRLGPEEMRGLLVFLCLSRKLTEQPLDNDIAVKLMRWQNACQDMR